MRHFYTTRQVGDMLDVPEWRVRRLYESGTLPEPSKFGGKRVIWPADVPAIVDCLRARGWLPASETAEVSP